MFYMWPVPMDDVRQEFHYPGHTAMDIAIPQGTPVKAVGDGEVLYAGWSNNMTPADAAPFGGLPYDGSAGIQVVVRHDNGFATNYCHLSEIRVSKGQRISMDTVVALSGNTGLSTGPHLHFEVINLARLSGEEGNNYGRVNPRDYVSERELLIPGVPDLYLP